METNILKIKKPEDISRALEIINFNELQKEPEGTYFKKDFKSWIVNESEEKNDYIDDYKLEYAQINPKNDKDKEKTQFTCFLKAMKILLVFGQFVGLNPVPTIKETDISRIRFATYSWIFIYSVFLAIIQTIAAGLCAHMLLHTPVSIKTLSYVSFYAATWCSTFIFIRIGTKWNILLKEIFNCNLDEYVDTSIIRRVKIACILNLILGSIEYILSASSRLAVIYDCSTIKHSLFEELMRQTFSFVFELGVPYSLPLGIFLQLTLIIAIFTWNYTDLFIVCTSMYLTTIFNQINKKIVWAVDQQYFSPAIWRALREDYTRATRLVRIFDEVISSLTFISFAGNLFFICLVIFNILANGLLPKQWIIDKCPNYAGSPLNGFEYPISMTYTLIYLFARFLTVALVAASVNVASLVPAPALYRIPSYGYSLEIQRFLNQIHGDFVALSGLDFFYVTRDLVLTVAATIVTYELVLLQFKSEDLNKA